MVLMEHISRKSNTNFYYSNRGTSCLTVMLLFKLYYSTAINLKKPQKSYLPINIFVSLGLPTDGGFLATGEKKDFFSSISILIRKNAFITSNEVLYNASFYDVSKFILDCLFKDHVLKNNCTIIFLIGKGKVNVLVHDFLTYFLTINSLGHLAYKYKRDNYWPWIKLQNAVVLNSITQLRTWMRCTLILHFISTNRTFCFEIIYQRFLFASLHDLIFMPKINTFFSDVANIASENKKSEKTPVILPIIWHMNPLINNSISRLTKATLFATKNSNNLKHIGLRYDFPSHFFTAMSLSSFPISEQKYLNKPLNNSLTTKGLQFIYCIISVPKNYSLVGGSGDGIIVRFLLFGQYLDLLRAGAVCLFVYFFTSCKGFSNSKSLVTFFKYVNEIRQELKTAISDPFLPLEKDLMNLIDNPNLRDLNKSLKMCIGVLFPNNKEYEGKKWPTHTKFKFRVSIIFDLNNNNTDQVWNFLDLVKLFKEHFFRLKRKKVSPSFNSGCGLTQHIWEKNKDSFKKKAKLAFRKRLYEFLCRRSFPANKIDNIFTALAFLLYELDWSLKPASLYSYQRPTKNLIVNTLHLKFSRLINLFFKLKIRVSVDSKDSFVLSKAVKSINPAIIGTNSARSVFENSHSLGSPNRDSQIFFHCANKKGESFTIERKSGEKDISWRTVPPIKEISKKSITPFSIKYKKWLKDLEDRQL